MIENNEKTLKKKNIFKQRVFEAIAIIFWLYSFIKLFVYDVDIYLIQNFLPSAAWIVEFKFPIILGLFATFWLFTKNQTVLSLVFYVIFFPVILVVWKIPKIIIKSKSWVAAFTFIIIVVSFFRSLKVNTIGFALVLIPTMLTWRCHNTIALWTAIGMISVFLIFLFLRALYFSFKPSLLFRMQSEVVSKFWNSFKSQCLPNQEIKDLSVQQMTEKQLKQWSLNLQNAVIFNRTCYFLTTKLRNFQKSKINVFFYVANFFFLVLLVIFSFAVLNFALFKIDPSTFYASFSPRFFHFLYYSTNTLFTNGIPDFYPVSTAARGFGTAEVLFAFALLGILFFLFTTVLSDRHNEDIENSINSMRIQGELLDGLIQENYRLTVEQAIQELERVKSAFIKAILYLSVNIQK